VLVVVDANVVVQLVISGGHPGPLAAHELIAPPLLRAEALSSISEMAFRGEIPPDAARIAALRLPGVDVRLDRPDGLDERIWDVTRSLGWATTYDAEYVALALTHGVPLLTLDGRLRRGAGHLVSMPRIVDLA
jgi:predicted nucleic acid-binding protein